MPRPCRTRRRESPAHWRRPHWRAPAGRVWVGGHDWRAAVSARPDGAALAGACAAAMAAAVAALAAGQHVLSCHVVRQPGPAGALSPVVIVQEVRA